MVHILTDRQKMAAAMLLAEVSAIEIARRLGRRRQAVSRWQKIPEFQVYMKELRRKNHADLRHGILDLAREMLAHLKGAMQHETSAEKRGKLALEALYMLSIPRLAVDISATSEALGRHMAHGS